MSRRFTFESFGKIYGVHRARALLIVIYGAFAVGLIAGVILGRIVR